MYYVKIKATKQYYFVDVRHIHLYYDEIDQIQIVIVPNNLKITPVYEGCILLKCEKGIILSDIHPLYEISSIQKFNLVINSVYIRNLSRLGRVDILEWLKIKDLIVNYNEDALTCASGYNRINVLEWWKNSGFKLKYDNGALYHASCKGYVDVLNWWKNSGLSLRYDENAFDFAVYYVQLNVLNWWVESKLPLKFTYFAFANSRNHSVLLNWWNSQKLKL